MPGASVYERWPVIAAVRARDQAVETRVEGPTRAGRQAK
jgi:hypothetical protein